MSDQTNIELATLSQWQLIQRRFSRHKLAVAALFMLVVLYALAFFAEFFAPSAPADRRLEYTYAPPTPVRFSFSKGFYTHPLARHVDPVTFRKIYREDESRILKLGFLAKGSPCRLLGLVPMQRHFFGIRGAQAADSDNVFFLFGADKYGRDIFSRIVYGSRVSLSIGLVGIVFTFLLGITIGGISGYVGGKTDMFIQRAIEIINAIPRLPLWLALGAALPDDWSSLRVYFSITVLISLLEWTGLARVVRGKILSLREEDYAVAARLLGASHARILFRHLLPGFTSHIIVSLTLTIPHMILGETALSFLGLGLRPPIVSWGVMLQDCMDIKGIQFYPWLMLPVIFVVLTVLCFNFLGDGMRDAADPYGR